MCAGFIRVPVIWSGSFYIRTYGICDIRIGGVLLGITDLKMSDFVLALGRYEPLLHKWCEGFILLIERGIWSA
jgi:hypothetical protein